jgi:hypothetical protein
MGEALGSSAKPPTKPPTLVDSAGRLLEISK